MDPVSEALRTAHAPAAHEPLRAQALQFLDDFKQSENSGEWAFHTLRTPTAPAEARHFALQCLASLLHSRWKGWDGSVRRQFRLAVMELVSSTGAGLNEEVFLRERIGLLVSGVAEKEYPQQWPEMLSDLATIWDSGGGGGGGGGREGGGGATPVIIALLALRNLAEDCVDSDFNNVLPTVRRTEILRALNMELPQVLPRLYALMARTYEGRGGEGGTGTGGVDILKAALQTLKRFVVWIPPELLLGLGQGQGGREGGGGGTMSFVDVFGFLMAEEPTRQDAVECLRDLGGRKYENCEHIKLYLEKMEGAVMALIPQGEAWRSLVFGESVCQVLAGFLTANLEKWLGEEKEVVRGGTREFGLLVRCLQLMTELLRLPSFRAAVALLPGWAVVLKQEKLRGLGVIEPLLPVVMTAYCDKSVKLCFDEESGSFPENPVADEEFIDLEEYLALLSTLKANAMTLMRTAAELYPTQAVDFLKERLPNLVRRFGTPEAAAATAAAAATTAGAPSGSAATSASAAGAAGATAAGGWVTVQSEAYRQFEGLVNPLDRILGGLPEPQQGSEVDVALVQNVGWLLSVLLEWHVTDPLLLYCHCLLLEGFKRFYRYFDQQLWAVLERLFTYMEYRDPALVGQVFPNASQLMKHLSPEALQVRRRGSNSLTEICNTVPDIVVPFLGELCTRCRALLVKGEVSDSQRPMLIEMLVVVANAIGDQGQRMTFIAELVADSEVYWESAATSQALASVPAFLQLFGVGEGGREGAQGGPSMPQTAEEWDEAYDRTHALLGALNTFLGVTRRLKVPQQDDISSKDPTLAGIARVLICDSLSLDELVQINPFVPVWVRILPNLLALLRVLHGMWAPDVRRELLAHPHARHLLSLNDDEVLSRVKAGGARPPQATVSAGGNQYRKWPTWLNQIRQSAYQLLEKACHHKVIYYHPATLLAMRETVLGPLVWMDHRHVPWLIKNFLEPYIVNCPRPLFATHLPPIIGPFFLHMLVRCSVTWGGGGREGGPGGELEHLVEGGTVVLTEGAREGGREGGLSVEDYETIVDKLRREVTRAYVEALQAALALRGGMIQALVESNKAVHHQQQTAKAAHLLTNGGGGREGGRDVQQLYHSSSSLGKEEGGGGGEGGGEGGGGNGKCPPPPCTAVKEFVDALTRFLVVDSDVCAVPLFLSVIGALCWQDQHSCRRAVHVAQRMLEIGGKEPKLYSAFGRELFREVVGAVLAEQAWVLGMQNDLVALATEIYRGMVIGENGTLGGGGGGGGGGEGGSVGGGGVKVSPRRTAQVVCEFPRQVLLGLPGLTPAIVGEMEERMLRTHQSKEQREFLKETLKIVVETMGGGKAGGKKEGGGGGGKKDGKKGGSTPVGKEESILRGGPSVARGGEGGGGGAGGGRGRSGSMEMTELQARLIRRGQALQAQREEVELCAASVASLFGE